ncbi:MAG: GAF domain-containing protein [Anaerolineales bacterium]|nr:GAF domain-containing protein [Anaerolineales bacterium]
MQTILFIEHRNEYVLRLRGLLNESVTLLHVHALDEAPLVLSRQPIDIILIDVGVVKVNLIDWIRTHAPTIPVVAIANQANERLAIKAFSAGIQDYLIWDQITLPILKNSINYAISRTKMQGSPEHNQEHLARIIEDQQILARVDRELGYTLNIDRVLNLAMDTAMRLTAASGCVIAWVEEETQRLQQLASVGHYTMLQAPIPLSNLGQYPLLAQSLEESAPLFHQEENSTFAQMLLPLIVQGKPAGLIVLENVPVGFCCDQADWDFLIQLAQRTAAALEKTRIYQRAHYQALQMDRLYELSTDISRHIGQKEVTDAAIAALTVLLDGSSAFFCEYEYKSNTMSIGTSFIADGMPDTPPHAKQVLAMAQYGELRASLYIQIMQYHLSEAEPPYHELLTEWGCKSALFVPLLDESNLLGMLVLCESRYNRYFRGDEIVLARNLAGSVTGALKKALLFASVRQLEQIKSEMIRMASHDLRTPLSRIYFSLALLEAGDDVLPTQTKLLTGVKEAAQEMQSLLEDMLNLERIESQEVSAWQVFDSVLLLHKVTATFRAHAEQHQHDYNLHLPPMSLMVHGSEIQLQQAYSNFISNAIKYTPDGGKITVRVWSEAQRLYFEVEDNGYGVPEERRGRLFERFYRANAPGTENIKGTGLGLSLVKSVIERHGGEVYYKAATPSGSIFGAWIPLHDEN